MARGNRRQPIVYSDADREVFAETLAEAANLAKFRTYAWVLMDNHYHWVLETPKANLVEGMTWFQNTITRRINSRNRLWGHLFGGRYKAILIEGSLSALVERPPSRFAFMGSCNAFMGSCKNGTALRPLFEENGHEKPGNYACVRV